MVRWGIRRLILWALLPVLVMAGALLLVGLVAV